MSLHIFIPQVYFTQKIQFGCGPLAQAKRPAVKRKLQFSGEKNTGDSILESGGPIKDANINPNPETIRVAKRIISPVKHCGGKSKSKKQGAALNGGLGASWADLFEDSGPQPEKSPNRSAVPRVSRKQILSTDNSGVSNTGRKEGQTVNASPGTNWTKLTPPSSSHQPDKVSAVLDCDENSRQSLWILSPAMSNSNASSPDRGNESMGENNADNNSDQEAINNEMPLAASLHKRKMLPKESKRKRSKNPNKWQRKVAMKAFNDGTEHITSKGKVKEAREMGDPCRDGCTKCQADLTHQQREAIFHKFWNLPNINRKRDFISRHIKTRTPDTCSTSPECAKKTSRQYFFSVSGEEIVVLICPRGETSIFFYKNKLSVFNFTVFDTRLSEGHCYVWTETDAHKGPNEIGTNLLRFIEKKASEGIVEFSFYSDGPTGQNRNRMNISLYLSTSAKFQVNITHRFLESGHSYSEADSMHARIEDEAKRVQEIFTPDEWINLIKNAKQSGKPYLVTTLKNEEVLDLHYLVDRRNWTGNSKAKIYWSQVREVSVHRDQPNILCYKYKFSDECSKLKVTMKNGNMPDMSTFTFPFAYAGRFPLNKNKANDLKELCRKNAIPSKYHETYETYLNFPEPNQDMEED
ncbi:Imidazolonepropionase [Frankliniella fusca]|uniref:Imidazolonepropionase n=1 Tax=Frankliniella fusca TaxID=407009 RepID=A0AAE1L6R1_9NEOP|nr:Imidazolonepropionase [Frankliniella fusca]